MHDVALGRFVEFLINDFQIGAGFRCVFGGYGKQKLLDGLAQIGFDVEVVQTSFESFA